VAAKLEKQTGQSFPGISRAMLISCLFRMLSQQIVIVIMVIRGSSVSSPWWGTSVQEKANYLLNSSETNLKCFVLSNVLHMLVAQCTQIAKAIL